MSRGFSVIRLFLTFVILRIPRIQGGQECTLSGTAELTATTNRQAWARPPIDVDFQVLMFTASGLLVRFLKVFEKNNYHSIKWVRYLTKANGGYQIRVRSRAILREMDLTSSLSSNHSQTLAYPLTSSAYSITVLLGIHIPVLGEDDKRGHPDGFAYISVFRIARPGERTAPYRRTHH